MNLSEKKRGNGVPFSGQPSAQEKGRDSAMVGLERIKCGLIS